MPDPRRVEQSTASGRAARRRHPGGIRRARHEGRANSSTSSSISPKRNGCRRTAPGSSPRRGPTRPSASACWPTARDAVAELGLTMPPHHRHLVVLENTPTVHNVICCTLCSCTAFTIIGLPPDWYKDLEYRARVVRESRTVLKEMGLDLPPEIEIRVWDTTADTRYMVLPVQPPRDRWAGPRRSSPSIVTKESMIGVARLYKRSRRRTMDGMHDLGGTAGLRPGPLLARRADLPRAVGEAGQRALFAGGQARHLQHGRVPPRDRAHGAAPLSVGELLRALADEPGDALRREGHRHARGARAPGRRPFPARLAERARPLQRGGARALQAGRQGPGAHRPCSRPCPHARLHPRQARNCGRRVAGLPVPRRACARRGGRRRADL